MLKTIKINEDGNLKLPQQVLDALGVKANSELIMELTDMGVFLKRKHSLPPITERIANMNLPVSEWEQMEAESEGGRES